MKFESRKAFSLIELSIVILIIGILIAGITSGSRLVKQFRVRTAQTLTASSPVASIKGLTFWLETSLDSSFLPDESDEGKVITIWNDNNPQGTIKFNAYAGSGASSDASKFYYNIVPGASTSNTSGPTYIADGINNVPTLRFSNTAGSTFRYLVVDSKMKNVPRSSQTMFMVVRPRTMPSATTSYFIDRQCLNAAGAANSCNTSASAGLPLFGAMVYPIGTPHLQMVGRCDAGDIGTFIGGETGAFHELGYELQENKTYIITVERKYGVSFTTYINGSSSYSPTSSTTDGIPLPPAITMDPVKIGHHADAVDTDTMDFDMSELIFFTGNMRKADRMAIEDYLGKKYGIKVSHN